jgi:F-type H+-transporting ATPase subunit a
VSDVLKNIAADVEDHWPPGTGSFKYEPLLGPEGWVTKITILVWIAVAILIVFYLTAYRNPKIVPTKGQWIAESIYGFARDGIAKDFMGADGVRFAPYLATLFSFVLLTNVFGIIPFAQISPNSHIAFPAVLAAISYVMFVYLGVRKFGFIPYFKKSLIPPGAPGWLLPLLIPLEFFSTFIMRPITLAARLWANMFAGHLVLLVFTLGGMLLLSADNFAIQGISVVSFAMAIVMTLFEFIVQILQAYVFTLLTAFYVSEAVAEEH